MVLTLCLVPMETEYIIVGAFRHLGFTACCFNSLLSSQHTLNIVSGFVLFFFV